MSTVAGIEMSARQPQRTVLQAVVQAGQSRQPVALATIVRVAGASPARPGFKLLVRADGSCLGNVGGGELEKRIRQVAQSVLADGTPQMYRFSLQEEGADAIGTLCGGEVEVYVEPYLPQPRLVIVGGGHIGRPLAELANIVGYDVQITDIDPDRGNLSQLDVQSISDTTYVVLMSEDHVTDEQALRQTLATPAPYIGMIGSRRKSAIIREHLSADGYDDADIARLHAPIGLDLGGREPTEIALSILAEVECIRHGGNGRSRSQNSESKPVTECSANVPPTGQDNGI
ncbi:MAG: XdhC family protein [Caldilineaceae bacterium]|nr:XdhC family protein [Caldilineaceae bacterium]